MDTDSALFLLVLFSTTDPVRLLLVISIFLLMARSITRANPPDYLTNDHEPAVRAGELASPFTEFVTEQPPTPLGTFSSEPFFRYAAFSLQPRLYYRNLQNNSGVQEAFAAGGSLSFTTGCCAQQRRQHRSPATQRRRVFRARAGLGEGEGRTGDGTLFRQSLQLPF